MRRQITNAALTALGVFLVALIGLAQPVAAQNPMATSKQPETQNKLKPGANSFAESQARDLLKKQGYSDVSPLMNGKDGIWHGKAVKNQTTYDVSVDYQGHVSAK